MEWSAEQGCREKGARPESWHIVSLARENRLTCQFEAWSLESPHNNTTSRTTSSRYSEKRQRSTLDSKRSDGVPKTGCLGVTTTTRSRLTGPPLNHEAFQRHFWKPRWNSQAGIAGDQSDREARNPAATHAPPTALWASDERLFLEGGTSSACQCGVAEIGACCFPPKTTQMRERARLERATAGLVPSRASTWFSRGVCWRRVSRHCDTDLILICAVGACLVELLADGRMGLWAEADEVQ